MFSRASNADFVLSHGMEDVCGEAAPGEFVSLEAAVDTVGGAESEDVVIDCVVDGKTAVVDVGDIAETDDVLYTSDGFTWSSVIFDLSSGKTPDFLNASTRIDGLITSSHVDLKTEQKFFFVISVFGFC